MIKIIKEGEFIMKFLLSVIAVCLVMITAKLYIPEVQADTTTEAEFEERVLKIVGENCDGYYGFSHRHHFQCESSSGKYYYSRFHPQRKK